LKILWIWQVFLKQTHLKAPAVFYGILRQVVFGGGRSLEICLVVCLNWHVVRKIRLLEIDRIFITKLFSIRDGDPTITPRM
jgi:hypothetical protein